MLTGDRDKDRQELVRLAGIEDRAAHLAAVTGHEMTARQCHEAASRFRRLAEDL